MRIQEIYIKTKINKIFVFEFILFMSFVFSTLVLFLSEGHLTKYFFHQDMTDSFMDFFNSIYYAHYQTEPDIYPPFATSIYKLIGNLIPIREFNYGVKNLRVSRAGSILLIFNICFFMQILYIMISKIIKDKDFNKELLVFLICFSGPIIWTIQRGNNIAYALLLTLYFIIYYKDSSAFLRNSAILALVLASSLKLYPAIFGLLLLEERRYKDIAKCIYLFFIVWILSAILCGFKMSDLFVGLQHIQSFTQEYVAKAGGINFSMKNSVFVFFRIFDIFLGDGHDNSSKHILIANIFVVLITIAMIIVFFFSEKKWQKYASLSLLCVFIPSVSYQYILIFMVIPLIYFLIDSAKGKLQIYYSILYGVMFSYIILPLATNNKGYKITIGFLFLLMATLMLALSIFVETLLKLREGKKNKPEVIKQ